MIPLNPHPAAASQPQRAGHIRIPNSLYDAITAFPFKLTTLRVLLAVLRKTEGYGKQEDDLSASQLASLCGAMSRQHVTTALNELAALNVIRKRPGRYGCVVGLNRDPAQWRQPARRAGMSGNGTGPQDGPLSESTAPGRPVAGQIDRPGFGQTTDNLPTDNPDNIPAAGPAHAGPAAPPPVIALALKDGSEYAVTESQAAEWRAAYRELNVDAELLRMRAWLDAKPQNRKTRRGIGAFVVGWLNRSLERRQAQASTTRVNAHARFEQQDYRAGVAADGSF